MGRERPQPEAARTLVRIQPLAFENFETESQNEEDTGGE